MDKNLLIVTSEPNFSELLRQALGQAGYRVLAAKTKGEAIFRADEENCALAFLDLDMGQKAVADIGRALRMLNPNFKLVLFSGTDAPPALDEIRPWVSLRKPFYLPDLLNMLNRKSAPVGMPSAPVPVSQQAKVGKAGASIPFGNTAMPWLDDVTKAAQHQMIILFDIFDRHLYR